MRHVDRTDRKGKGNIHNTTERNRICKMIGKIDERHAKEETKQGSEEQCYMLPH